MTYALHAVGLELSPFIPCFAYRQEFSLNFYL